MSKLNGGTKQAVPSHTVYNDFVFQGNHGIKELKYKLYFSVNLCPIKFKLSMIVEYIDFAYSTVFD